MEICNMSSNKIMGILGAISCAIFLSIKGLLLLDSPEFKIAYVKEGILDTNKTLTVGEALDNWNSCSASEWTFIETDNGVDVVQFECLIKYPNFLRDQKTFTSLGHKVNDSMLKVSSITQEFQFTLNKDNTFQLHGIYETTMWDDGDIAEKELDLSEQLELVYSNTGIHILTHPSQLDYISSTSLLYELGATKLIASGMTELIDEPDKQSALPNPQSNNMVEIYTDTEYEFTGAFKIKNIDGENTPVIVLDRGVVLYHESYHMGHTETIRRETFELMISATSPAVIYARENDRIRVKGSILSDARRKIRSLQFVEMDIIDVIAAEIL